MKRKPSPSLKNRLGHAIITACLFTFACVPVLVVGSAHHITYDPKPGTSQISVSRAERMVESGRCWTGEAPAEMQGVVPGHVWADGQYRGERAVGKALEQIFNGVDHGMQVQAFCR